MSVQHEIFKPCYLENVLASFEMMLKPNYSKINKSTGQQANGSTGQRIHRSTDQQANGSTGQRIHRSTDQQVNGSTGQWVNQANRPTGQQANRPTGQQANRPPQSALCTNQFQFQLYMIKQIYVYKKWNMQKW